MAQIGVQTRPDISVKEPVTVSASELRKLKNCEKAWELSQIGLRLDGWQVKDWIYQTLSAVKNAAMVGQTADEIHAVIESKAGEMQESWYSCKTEADAESKKTVQILHRFVDFLCTYTVCAVDRTYTIHFNTMEYRGVAMDGYRGRIDFLLRDAKGKYHAVKLCLGKPTESARARKQLNLPEYSLDLIHTYMGGRTVFKEAFLPEIWYLSNKDDNGTSLISHFEHREGKNIISFDFSKWSDEQSAANWRRALSGPQECNCKDCRFSCVCHIDEHLRFDKNDNTCEKKTVQTGKKQFTKAQESVIDHVNGPMCVVAVPGAGKTTVLSERVVHLVEEHYAKPEQILLVTFTKKAAREMQERIADRFHMRHIKGMPQISTYHALGFSILKENPLFFGKGVLSTDTDRQALIYDLWKELPRIEGLSTYDPCGKFGAVHTLDRMFQELDEGMDAEVFGKRHSKYDTSAVRDAYVEYQKRYKAKHYISFDDQISMVNELFAHFPILSEHYAKKFTYIMVDEFQDSSEEQVDMIYTIAHHHNNLVVVGDDDQSIYGWRGGSSKYMMEFGLDFSGAKTVYMQDNFRCNAGVADVCNAIISEPSVTCRYDKALIAHKSYRFKPVFARGADAAFVGNLLMQAQNTGVELGKIAVLARSNKRLEELSEALNPDIPVSLAKDYLVEDDVFKGLYDVMSLCYGEEEDAVWYRTMYRMGAEKYCRKSKTEGLGDVLRASVEPTVVQALEKVDCCISDMQALEMREALRRVCETLYGTREHLVLTALFDLADTRTIVHAKDLYDTVSDMVRFHSAERVGYAPAPDCVNLLTCHDAKGMEFDMVIVYGIEDFDIEDEEEVRVLYVAASRAKETLYLVETGTPLQFSGFERIAQMMQVV